MKCALLIKGGTVVFPNRPTKELDVLVDGGRIVSFAEPGLVGEDTAREVIDARGLHIFPGVVDPHQHIGIYNPMAEDFVAETKAAAIGGVTTIINYYRGKESYLESVPELIAIGEKNSMVDFTFSLGLLTRRHVKEVKDYAEELGITSYKFYRNYQDAVGRIFGVDDPLDLDGADLAEILDVFARTSDRLVLCVHCEDMDIQRKTQKALQAGSPEDTLEFFSRTSPDFGETVSLMDTLYLQNVLGGNVYIVHLSAGTSVEFLQRTPWLSGTGVTVETCPHYLALTKDSPCGLLAKVNPPVRSQADCERLWEGIKAGIIKTIGSDNCPSRLEKKYGKGRDVWSTLPGFPGSGIILPVMLGEGYHRRGIPLQTIAAVTAYEPARALGLAPQKGTLEVGADADLVLVDLALERTVTAETFGSSDYSVYEGMKFKGWPVVTLSRGEVIARDGVVVAEPGRGRFLRRSL